MPASSIASIPPLVRQAQQIAERMQFGLSCRDDTGRLLRLLASQFRSGAIGETGSGCGVGAAWIVSGLAPEATFVTIERDPARAEVVRGLFTPFANVRTVEGDWSEILTHGPFDMLFLDGGGDLKGTPDGRRSIDRAHVDAVLAALRPGGLIVFDDLSPGETWPPEWRGKEDPNRAFWLNDPRVIATEITVTAHGGPASGVILATRVE